MKHLVPMEHGRKGQSHHPAYIMPISRYKNCSGKHRWRDREKERKRRETRAVHVQNGAAQTPFSTLNEM